MSGLREHLLAVLHPAPESNASVLPEALDDAWDDASVDLLPAVLQPAAVLIPLIRRPHGYQILLTKRAANLKHHAGQISFPGGRAEDADVSPAATALRETQEEVGIEPSRVEIIGSLDRFQTISGYRITPLVGLVEAGFKLKLDADEVDEVFEVPLDFLLDSGNHQRRSKLYKGRQRQYFVIQYGAILIWGATAAMLVNFSKRYHRL